MTGAAAFALAIALSSAAQGGQTPPAAVVGTWDVVRVAVDRQDTLHQDIRADDPRLLGRTLVVGPDGVSFPYDKKLGCAQPAWSPQGTTWGVLVGKGFPRPAMGGKSATPSPKDFGMKVTAAGKVTAYSFCPSKTGKFPADKWLAPYENSLALRYDSQVLLLLGRRGPDARPKPSFECGHASTPTEKAICDSFELAALDRSVAAAFREALTRSSDEAATLRQTQKDWLKTRDACGASAACIEEKASARIAELAFY
jgi:uncharacterized protein YecT (DUF1311 family)